MGDISVALLILGVAFVFIATVGWFISSFQNKEDASSLINEMWMSEQHPQDAQELYDQFRGKGF